MKLHLHIYSLLILTLISSITLSDSISYIDKRDIPAEMGIFKYKEIYLLSWIEYENSVTALVAIRHLNNQIEMINAFKTLKPTQKKWEVSSFMLDSGCERYGNYDCWHSRQTYGPNPTEEEIRSFVSRWWYFKINKIPSLLGYGINNKIWKELFGFEPDYEFEFKS